MKTTLVIPDPLMQRLREKAAREKTTISELVIEAIRVSLAAKALPHVLPPLPRHDLGGAKVNVANREELSRVMGEAP